MNRGSLAARPDEVAYDITDEILLDSRAESLREKSFMRVMREGEDVPGILELFYSKLTLNFVNLNLG